MIVERNANVVVDRGVDETQAVLLSTLEVLDLTVATSSTVFVLHRPVNQDGVTWRTGPSLLKSHVEVVLNLEGGAIVPVGDSVGSKIRVIVGRSGAIDDKLANCTITILRREMTVEPSRAELGSLE